MAAYAAALIYYSGRPGSPAIFEYVWDKALHAGAYAGLAILVIRALHGGLGRFRAGLALGAALAATVFGALEEVHQRFVPGRDSSLGDVGADAVGALLAVALAYLIHRAAARYRTVTEPSRDGGES